MGDEDFQVCRLIATSIAKSCKTRVRRSDCYSFLVSLERAILEASNMLCQSPKGTYRMAQVTTL